MIKIKQVYNLLLLAYISKIVILDTYYIADSGEDESYIHIPRYD